MASSREPATALSGLTAAAVHERIEAGQVNDVPRRTSRPVGEILRANIFTRVNAIIGVLFVLIVIFGQGPDWLFGGIIVANTAIGIVQELRAKRTLDRLAVIGETPVRVRRDGRPVDLHRQQIVLDDLILLGPGERIVVDGKVCESAGLEVDESLLTGEADPVHKNSGDQVMSGSFVVAGTGAFTAAKVGRDAYAARLVEEASRFSLAHSELQSGINRFLKYVTWAIIPTALLLIISQLTADQRLGDAVSRTVAGLVAMVPEGLVLLTSIAFAVGVVRLGRRGCLVQELPAIEGLARVDVLCLDKTGTLTEPGMDLDEVLVLRDDLPVRAALAALAHADPRPNQTMQAVAASVTGPPPWTAARTVPFSSARKWSGAEFDGLGAWVLGAADTLLPPEDPHRAQAEELGSGGLRVLTLATTESLGDPDRLGSVRPAAFVVLRQRLRPEAAETLRYFEEQGVAIKVISGDNPVSVGAIASELKIEGGEHPVDARTLPEDIDEMGEVLDANSVFGRVTPRQKRGMVKALQARGHTVAMTGDGVNDVLALKDADLGVSMGSGSGATRAVAKVVLLNDSFATLPHVVAEGRRVLGNIERVANLFITKTMYSILLAVLAGVVHVAYPFLPRHLTLISSLTIGIPAFFLALAPNIERARPGFVRRVMRFAVPSGTACALATFLAYFFVMNGDGAARPPAVQDSSTATITLFAMSIWVLALIARPYTWWRIGLVLAMTGCFVGVLAVPYARDFFALYLGGLGDDGIALTMALAGAGLLTAVLLIDHWLPRRRRRSGQTVGSRRPG